VRRICPNCRESVPAEGAAWDALRSRPDFEELIRALQKQGALAKGANPLAGSRLFKGKGCIQCGSTGFRGRLGIFELFEIDDEIRHMMTRREDAMTIRAAAVASGMKTLFQDGLAKALLGQTTLEEVFRVAL